jgi:hypothetical protein
MLKSHNLARQHAVLEPTYSEHDVHALGMPSDYRRMRYVYTALLHKDAPESHQTGTLRLLYQPPVPPLRLSLEIAVSACQRIVSNNVLLQLDRTPRPRGKPFAEIYCIIPNQLHRVLKNWHSPP